MKTTQNQFERLADLLYEIGMLRHIPRSGYAFLGTGQENVAEHSYRVAMIGYILARLSGTDPARVTLLCLFHDLHETRTGDFNYVNQRYNECRARKALEDALEGTGISNEVLAFFDEFEASRNLEADLARDADQLDLICNLATELAKGNTFAAEWIESALQRLRTSTARELAENVLRTDPNRWWYGRVDKNWWVTRGK